MKRILLIAALILTPIYAWADCTVTASNGKTLPLCSLENTFAFTGTQVQTISVTYQGVTYVQTFTYAGGNVATISSWIAQS